MENIKAKTQATSVTSMFKDTFHGDVNFPPCSLEFHLLSVNNKNDSSVNTSGQRRNDLFRLHCRHFLCDIMFKFEHYG